MALPLFSQLLEKQFLVPFIVYFTFFRIANVLLKQKYWQNFEGFKKYRLHNLSICLLHSLISGTWSLTFFLCNWRVMIEELATWNTYFAAQLPLFSIAYFCHDAIDMLNYEWSRWTLELIIHHLATCFSLSTGIVSKTFVLCDYWALLMEVNSIFLHCRTIMQISGQNKTNRHIFKIVLFLNIASFILFRFLTQIVFVYLILFHFLPFMDSFYVIVALGGPIVFLIINGMLFFRILASDGFLTEEWKSRAAITRYPSV
ncbi:unnamed protein product [Auanema sp. JU1783]|nr:unnamed protein product [Auanema sp. JU1783]